MQRIRSDRVPEELWTEVRDIVHKAGIKTIPKKMKCKKAKWLSEEALQIAVKRREGKGKGEKESYTHWNAEFQRIARRDKKDFLSDQCKVIEGNNRVGGEWVTGREARAPQAAGGNKLQGFLPSLHKIQMGIDRKSVV